ncbi:MAG: phospholipase D-like domain-containing protein, partial [Terriglobales bacterium]
EQQNAGQRRDPSTTDMLRGERNVEIRVKPASRSNLMHLKAYLVDGALLRDGSANWSPSGLKRQNNNARYSNHPAQARAFAAEFEQMWSGSGNQVVQ